MIGVSPCADPPSGTDDGDSSILLNRSTAAGGVANSSVATLNSSLGGARLNTSIRPLAQAYKAADGDVSIRGGSGAGGSGTPNRNGGIVGKAMEYIFGW